MNESDSVFTELEDDGLDIEAIFGGGASSENPFETPEPAQEPTAEKQEAPAEQKAAETPPPAPEKKAPRVKPEKQEEIPDPISAAVEAKTHENTQKGLYDKLPIFYHKGAKETIEDTSMTFEELRIREHRVRHDPQGREGPGGHDHRLHEGERGALP